MEPIFTSALWSPGYMPILSQAQSPAPEVAQKLQEFESQLNETAAKLQQAAGQLEQFVYQLDELWLMLCAVLVFFMQAGFCSLESGLSRSKNSMSGAIMNLFDFCLCAPLYWAVGFGLMYGFTWLGLLGTTRFFYSEFSETNWETAFFVYQLGCCGISITIVSGAVAERMRIVPYAIIALAVGTFIYPIFGHWVWGWPRDLASFDPATLSKTGWLARLGFVDFAGATVVHSLGAWVALAAVLFVRPRRDREKNWRRIHGHNLPMSTLGLFILWLGWFGFTGGRAFAPSVQAPLILANTLLAGAVGGIGGLFLDALHRMIRPTAHDETLPQIEGTPQFSVESVINGVLGGLVAISASCNLVNSGQAMLIGLIASFVVYATTLFLDKCRVDDVVGAIPAHGFAGAWGTLAVAIFVPEAADFWFQLLGIAVCFAWAFGLTSLVLAVMKYVPHHIPYLTIRVSAEEEELGLNYAQHGAKPELHDLISTMRKNLGGEWEERAPEEEEFTDAGNLARLYNLLLDGRAELEKARADAEKRKLERHAAEQADRAKSEFLALMSHEIRSPLQAINGFIEILARKLKSTEDRENIQIIQENGEYLLELIDDILDLAKIEEGKMDIQKRPFSLEKLVEEVARLMKIRRDAKGLDFHVEFTRPIPETVYTDRTRLRQILVNLVGNAIKFTEVGEVRLHVSSVLKDGREMLQFDVVDTGIGMDYETQKKLFRPFTQGSRSEARGDRQGTGLGLTISRRLAKMLGGDIWFRSTLDKGSTFSVSIDCGMSEKMVIAGAEDALFADDGSGDHSDVAEDAEIRLHCLVLLAEDGRDNRKLLSQFLTTAGADVVVAENGEVAVTRVLSAMGTGGPFDLVLMDMRMPEMDGHEATRQLRAAGFDGPVIALTAHAMSDDRQKCLDSGCNDYLAKPVKERKLLAMVKKYTADIKETIAGSGRGLHSALADQESHAELIRDFVATLTDEYLEPIKILCESQRWADLYEVVHSLKGAAGTYGFEYVTPLAQHVLQLIGDEASGSGVAERDANAIEQAIDRLMDVCRRLRPGVSPVYDSYFSG